MESMSKKHEIWVSFQILNPMQSFRFPQNILYFVLALKDQGRIRGVLAPAATGKGPMDYWSFNKFFSKSSMKPNARPISGAPSILHSPYLYITLGQQKFLVPGSCSYTNKFSLVIGQYLPGCRTGPPASAGWVPLDKCYDLYRYKQGRLGITTACMLGGIH